MKLIPALNVKSFDELKYKIKLLYPKVKHFHYDLATLRFCNYETLDIKHVERLDLKIQFDLHLMDFFQPLDLLKYRVSYISTIIFHPRGTSKVKETIKILKKIKKKIFVALEFDEDIDESFLKNCDGILFLGVKAGKSGQNFQSKILTKAEIYLQKIKLLNKKLKIGFDGGLNKETLPLIVKFQPDFVVLGSAIFDQKDPLASFNFYSNFLKKINKKIEF